MAAIVQGAYKQQMNDEAIDDNVDVVDGSWKKKSNGIFLIIKKNQKKKHNETTKKTCNGNKLEKRNNEKFLIFWIDFLNYFFLTMIE